MDGRTREYLKGRFGDHYRRATISPPPAGNEREWGYITWGSGGTTMVRHNSFLDLAGGGRLVAIDVDGGGGVDVDTEGRASVCGQGVENGSGTGCRGDSLHTPIGVRRDKRGDGSDCTPTESFSLPPHSAPKSSSR